MTPLESFIRAIIEFVDKFFRTIKFLLFKANEIRQSIKLNEFQKVMHPRIFFVLSVFIAVTGLNTTVTSERSGSPFKMNVGNFIHEFSFSLAQYHFFDTLLSSFLIILLFHVVFYLVNLLCSRSKVALDKWNNLLFYYVGLGLIFAVLVIIYIALINITDLHLISDTANILTLLGLLIIVALLFTPLIIKFRLITDTLFDQSNWTITRIIIGMILCMSSMFLVSFTHENISNNISKYRDPSVYLINDRIHHWTDKLILDVLNNSSESKFIADVMLVNNGDATIYLEANMGFMSISTSNNDTFYFQLKDRDKYPRFLTLGSNEMLAIQLISNSGIKQMYPKLKEPGPKSIHLSFMTKGKREEVVQPLSELLFE